ncbi:LysR family transcriptional regulator [Shewanella maritima]|uniref:LysR family transcriptional regulator n=1 Tax=Shewanella maritima TaxID=2520507 RepID=A0A411PKI7_9GAMM|nr:LysR family transcriptional regulator [Shewanella maritima]QBF84031.1 LysR family transcriptional regulator [Shewanella maritima]
MKEFDGLPLFAKVVELKSFAEAARQLQLPTTTVSRKIQQLEAELGGKLLNRTTRALSLTELGEQVLPKAMLIQDTIKELQTDAEAFANQPMGKLHISAPRSFCQHLLAPLLAEFRSLYPGIKLELEAANRIQDLTKSRVDFAFRIGELKDSSLIALPLTAVDYELTASKAYLDQNQAPKHPVDLIKHPSIRNHVDGYILPWQFSQANESYSHQADADLLSDDLDVSVTYTLANLGISYLPVSLTKRYLESGELITLLPNWDKLSPIAYLLYPNRKHLPQKAKLFIEFIKQRKSFFKDKLTYN